MKKRKKHHKTQCFVSKVYISEWTGCVEKGWDPLQLNLRNIFFRQIWYFFPGGNLFQIALPLEGKGRRIQNPIVRIQKQSPDAY